MGGGERGREEIAYPAPPSLPVDAHAGPLLVQGVGIFTQQIKKEYLSLSHEFNKNTNVFILMKVKIIIRAILSFRSYPNQYCNM